MRLLLLLVILFSINSVYSDENVEIDQKTSKDVDEISVKTKRGLPYNLGYPIYGRTFTRYIPSGIPLIPNTYKNPVATYALTPGNAVVHSFNVNYPKKFLRPTPPILYHAKLPLPSVPIYANRYPIFVPKPVFVHKPILPIPVVPMNPSIPSVLPQPTLVSQSGWRPIFSTLPNAQPAHINPPSVTVLPPSTTSQSQTPNNYYLPPLPAVQHEGVRYTQSGDCF